MLDNNKIMEKGCQELANGIWPRLTALYLGKYLMKKDKTKLVKMEADSSLN